MARAGLPATMEFSLAPKQIKNIQVNVIKMLTDAGLDSSAANALFGARVKVEGFMADVGGNASGPDLIGKHFFAYRFKDVADDVHTDGKVDFIKRERGPQRARKERKRVRHGKVIIVAFAIQTSRAAVGGVLGKHEGD